MSPIFFWKSSVDLLIATISMPASEGEHCFNLGEEVRIRHWLSTLLE